MKYLKTFESMSQRGDDYIVDIVNFIKTMDEYGLVATDDIEITSKIGPVPNLNVYTREYTDSLEMLIYVKYGKNRKYTIWVTNSSVIIYGAGLLQFGYDYAMITDKDAYENCMSILRKNTLEVRRSRGRIGKKGKIEHLVIPNFKEVHDKLEKDKEDYFKNTEPLKPETIKMLKKMFKDAGLDL
jgi:hypothetical protein